jgi:CHAT domain-containing protein/tetratricopeptide (TPR) repeat protein
VAARARATTWLGLAAWRQGRYSEAKELGERALATKLEAGLHDQLSRSYNALGLVAWDESRFENAAALFGQAADAANDVGDAAGAARASGNLALVATEWGEFAKAREGYATMLRAGRALGDGVMAGNALTNLGALEIMVGRPLHAIPLLQEAIGLYREIDYPTGLENALGQLGSAYAVLGNLGGAHVVYDSALAIARSQGLRQQEANDLAVIAELYVAADNRVRALELYAEAQDIYADTGLETELGRSLRAQAEIFAELGNNDRALDLATRSLETHRRVGARFEELEGLVVLSELEESAGSEDRADSLLAEARELASELGTRSAAASVALAAARISDERSESERVIAAIGDAGPRLFQGDYETEWEAQALRARAFLHLGEVDSALAVGRRAVSTVERVRGSFRSRAMRAGFAAARQKTYADLMTALLRAGMTSKAFVVADQARGHALREHVGLRGSSGRPGEATEEAGHAEELLRRIGQLVSTLDAIQAEGGVGVDTAAALLWARLARARSDYEALQISLAERTSSSASPRYADQLESEVQAALQPGEVLLEYFVMPDRVVAFIITRDTSLVVASEVAREDLESRVRLARKLVGSPDGSPDEAAPVLEALYETLIAPAARSIPLSEADLLILVPHAVLTYLPFAALLEPDRGRRLVEILPLLHLPSAASLPELHSRGSGGLEVSFAEDVTYVLAPFPRELPATNEEAQAVMPLRPEALFYRGATATEERLRSVLESGGLVHFASHAVMNARNPLFSRLELAPGRSERTDDDGRLEIHEILDLQIKTPLIYLSGCDTGLGPATATRFDSGEDYSTLAQSFLYVGAQNVLATLWRVEDQSAALLAGFFYEELRDLLPSQALAHAQLRMISHPEFSDPFYWAGYRLNGSGR